jgi:hypothetical protein
MVMEGKIDSPFNMENILRADPYLLEVWKKRPFIFDLDAYGNLTVKIAHFDDVKNSIIWMEKK